MKLPFTMLCQWDTLALCLKGSLLWNKVPNEFKNHMRVVNEFKNKIKR